MLTVIWNCEGRKLEELHSLVSHRIYTRETDLLWWLCSSCRAYVLKGSIYLHRGKKVVCIGKIGSVSID